MPLLSLPPIFPSTFDNAALKRKRNPFIYISPHLTPQLLLTEVVEVAGRDEMVVARLGWCESYCQFTWGFMRTWEIFGPWGPLVLGFLQPQNYLLLKW